MSKPRSRSSVMVDWVFWNAPLIPTTISFAIIGFYKHGLPWGSLGYVNVPAALAISSMSVLTAPLGVAAAHRLPAASLKRVFGAYLVLISLFMFKNALKL